jgi:hypothetical protein
VIALYALLFSVIYIPVLAIFGYAQVQMGIDLGSTPNTIALLISAHLAAFAFLKRRRQSFTPTQFTIMLVGCSAVNLIIQIGGVSLTGGLNRLSGRFGEFLLILLGQSICIGIGLLLGARFPKGSPQPNP